MEIPDIQIIDGKFYTKPAAPPEPVEIPRATVEGWLAAAEVAKTDAETSKQQAADSKSTTLAQIDQTIEHWDTAMNEAAGDIETIQKLLDQVPE